MGIGGYQAQLRKGSSPPIRDRQVVIALGVANDFPPEGQRIAPVVGGQVTNGVWAPQLRETRSFGIVGRDHEQVIRAQQRQHQRQLGCDGRGAAAAPNRCDPDSPSHRERGVDPARQLLQVPGAGTSRGTKPRADHRKVSNRSV